MRKSCVIYDSWADQILNLPDDVAGQYIKAILKYAIYGEDTESDNTFLNAMLVPVKKKLDDDYIKYQEQVERMNRNRKKSDRSQTEVRVISDRSQTEVVSDTDTVTVTDTVTEYKKKNNKKKNGFKNFNERSYNYESLVSEINNV